MVNPCAAEVPALLVKSDGVGQLGAGLLRRALTVGRGGAALLQRDVRREGHAERALA